MLNEGVRLLVPVFDLHLTASSLVVAGRGAVIGWTSDRDFLGVSIPILEIFLPASLYDFSRAVGGHRWRDERPAKCEADGCGGTQGLRREKDTYVRGMEGR